jgi:Ca2+-transporting ATPase
VAKEIADLVLLNNTFSTVVAAIEEGRAIHAQIRRVLVFLLSGSFTEVVLVFTSILFGLPVPLTAVQILWINILTDGPPSFALIFEGKDPLAMREGPTRKDDALLPLPITIFSGLVSLMTGMVAFGMYLYYMNAGIEHAQTLVFFLVVIFSIVYVFSVRTLLQPMWKESLLSNKVLIFTCLATMAFQAFCVFNPSARQLLGLRMVSPAELIMLAGMSLLVLMGVEGIKSAVRTIQPAHARD